MQGRPAGTAAEEEHHSYGFISGDRQEWKEIRRRPLAHVGGRFRSAGPLCRYNGGAGAGRPRNNQCAGDAGNDKETIEPFFRFSGKIFAWVMAWWILQCHFCAMFCPHQDRDSPVERCKALKTRYGWFARFLHEQKTYLLFQWDYVFSGGEIG